MITKEQIEELCGDGDYNDSVLAVLTRDYKPDWLKYVLPKGTVVKIGVYKLSITGLLFMNNKTIDPDFPYDAAELLEK